MQYKPNKDIQCIKWQQTTNTTINIFSHNTRFRFRFNEKMNKRVTRSASKLGRNCTPTSQKPTTGVQPSTKKKISAMVPVKVEAPPAFAPVPVKSSLPEEAYFIEDHLTPARQESPPAQGNTLNTLPATTTKAPSAVPPVRETTKPSPSPSAVPPVRETTKPSPSPFRTPHDNASVSPMTPAASSYSRHFVSSSWCFHYLSCIFLWHNSDIQNIFSYVKECYEHFKGSIDSPFQSVREKNDNFRCDGSENNKQDCGMYTLPDLCPDT